MSESVRHDAVAWSRDTVADSGRDIRLRDGVRPDRRSARSPVAKPATPQSSQATVPIVIPPEIGAEVAPVGGSITMAAMPAAPMRKIPTAKDTSPIRLDITRSKRSPAAVAFVPGLRVLCGSRRVLRQSDRPVEHVGRVTPKVGERLAMRHGGNAL